MSLFLFIELAGSLLRWTHESITVSSFEFTLASLSLVIDLRLGVFDFSLASLWFDNAFNELKLKNSI
jgi:hypothetical protein